VQLAGAVGAQLGVLVADLQVLHRVDLVGRVVPVVRVALGAHVAALQPFREYEGAIRDLFARSRKAVTQARMRVHVQRRAGRVREQCG
jgi:hypothetical protein